MQDIYVETEVLTLPLRFAMIASRVAAILKGIQQGRPLDEKSKQSLRAASEMLDRAAEGRTVVRNRSMAGYSAEAMSAYHIVQEAKLPGAETRDPKVVIERLNQISEELRELAENKTKKIPVENLQQFFTFLTKRSLDQAAGREEVVRLG